MKSALLIALCFMVSLTIAQSHSSDPLSKPAREKYNEAIELSGRDFNDLETEKLLIAKIEDLFQKTMALDSSNIELLNIKLIKILSKRAIDMVQYYNKNPSAFLFLYIEEVYSKALALDPENVETNYNFGAFYYNTAVFLSKQTVDEKVSEASKKEMIELFRKAKPYLEKAKSAQK